MKQDGKQCEDMIKVEYHEFPENTFCSGAAFVAKPGDAEEDDGWIITYVQNENSNTSHVSNSHRTLCSMMLFLS